jgi:putative holliday junction resolvase
VRVLAVDHGEARSGLAVCDPTGVVVRPLDVVAPTKAEEVARVAREQEADVVVVGLPVSLDGSEGRQAEVARRFRDRLARALPEIPVETYDERLTTRMAEASAREGAGAAPDSLAAAHLLESWLAARGGEA